MDEQKKPRAWVYARIPGDYDGTMNSFKVCSMQALRDGCDIVGGSTDEHGGWLLRPGYREMMQQVKVGNVDCIYICRIGAARVLPPTASYARRNAAGVPTRKRSRKTAMAAHRITTHGAAGAVSRQAAAPIFQSVRLYGLLLPLLRPAAESLPRQGYKALLFSAAGGFSAIQPLSAPDQIIMGTPY